MSFFLFSLGDQGTFSRVLPQARRDLCHASNLGFHVASGDSMYNSTTIQSPEAYSGHDARVDETGSHVAPTPVTSYEAGVPAGPSSPEPINDEALASLLDEMG